MELGISSQITDRITTEAQVFQELQTSEQSQEPLPPPALERSPVVGIPRDSTVAVAHGMLHGGTEVYQTISLIV
jgi:hypothetical protein